MITDQGIQAISDGASKVVGEIGTTVRELGNKRYKSVDRAYDLHAQRLQAYQKAKEKKADYTLPIVLGVMGLIIIIALIVKK